MNTENIEAKNKVATFKQYTLDCNAGVLSDEQASYHLEPKVFQFMLLLISNQGEILTKPTIIEKLWNGKSASDEAIRALVKKTRESLKDDARSPQYIKTMPTKGYLFIPPVDFKQISISSKKSKLKYFLFLGLLCVTILFMSIAFLTTSPKDDVLPPVENTVVASVINGSVSKEVNVYYQSGDSYLRLEKLYDEIGEVVKVSLEPEGLSNFLAFPGGAIEHFGISNDKKAFYAIVMRQEKRFINYWSLGANLALIEALEFELPKVNGNFVNFNFDENVVIESTIDLSTNTINLHLYGLINATERELSFTSPSTLNSELSVEISPDNKYVAVIVPQISHSDFLLFSIDDNVLLQQKSIPVSVVQSLWADDTKQIIFRSRDGYLLAYQLSSDSLISWNEPLLDVSELFGVCGDGCFIGRALKTDIGLAHYKWIEKPYFADGSVLHQIGNPRYPVAHDNRVFFIENADEQSQLIEYSSLDAQAVVLYTFEGKNELSYLSINQSGNILAGILNGRVFIFNLEDKSFSLLKVPMVKMRVPVFHPNNENILYFSAADPLNGEAVFEYDLSQSTYERLQGGLLQKVPLGESMYLTVDQLGRLSVIKKTSLDSTSDSEEVIFETRVSSAVSWQLVDDKLLVLSINAIGYLSQINLSNGDVTKVQLPTLPRLSEFLYLPESDSFILPVTINSQHQIIKYEGLTKAY